MKNNYFDIALNDLSYYEESSRKSIYNNKRAIECQQITEKMLKSVAEHIVSDESELKTHNLRNLYKKIKGQILLKETSELYLATLTDYYFCARYPGDDFENVSDEDMKRCDTVMKEVCEQVKAWHNKDKSNKDLLSEAISKMGGN